MMKQTQMDFLKNYAEGNSSYIQFGKSVAEAGINNQPNRLFYRYVIVDVVTDPGLVNLQSIEQQAKKIEWYQSIGISNIDLLKVLPRNTIIGKRLNLTDSGIASELEFLLPFFPSHLSFPAKPGEHVWVIFETLLEQNTGYWISKVPGLGFVEDVNHEHSPREYDASFFQATLGLSQGKKPEYKFRPGVRSSRENEESETDVSTYLVIGEEDFYENVITTSEGSRLITKEAIPRYKKRPGDLVLEGSNNSLIVLGTLRSGSLGELTEEDDNSLYLHAGDESLKSQGSIDLVVGRGQTPSTMGQKVNSRALDGSTLHEEIGKSVNEQNLREGDPDLINDRSRVLLLQRGKPDKLLNLDDFNISKFEIEDDPTGSGAIVIKTDKIRFVARQDVQILVTGFEKRNEKAFDSGDDTQYASITIKSNGDIIFKPSDRGVIKLGGDEANLAPLCSRAIAGVSDGTGKVMAPPIIDTMGGSQGIGGSSGQFSKKVLIM